MKLIRERWERELAKAEEHKRAGGALIPDQALLLQRMYIDIFSRCDGGALASAGELATGLGPDAASAATGLVKSNPAESDLIRPDPTKN